MWRWAERSMDMGEEMRGVPSSRSYTARDTSIGLHSVVGVWRSAGNARFKTVGPLANGHCCEFGPEPGVYERQQKAPTQQRAPGRESPDVTEVDWRRDTPDQRGGPSETSDVSSGDGLRL